MMRLNNYWVLSLNKLMKMRDLLKLDLDWLNKDSGIHFQSKILRVKGILMKIQMILMTIQMILMTILMIPMMKMILMMKIILMMVKTKTQMTMKLMMKRLQNQNLQRL